MRSFVAIAVLAVVAVAKPTIPKLASLHADGNIIDDNYIVVFKKEVDLNAIQAHTQLVEGAHLAAPLLAYSPDGQVESTGGISKVYWSEHHNFKGYAGAFSNEALDVIRSQPEVAYVERDQIVTINNPDSETYTVQADPAITTQRQAPWGLARVSHRPELKLGTFTVYEYVESGGEGVDVYIIDTGINIDHVEFEGRAHWGKTIPKAASDSDGNGHGSHCAGTIASRAYGVAKKANVYAVKVLGDNGSGSMSDVIDGITWASEQAYKKKAAALAEFAATGFTAHKGSIGSMSLGGGASKATDQATDEAVTSGLFMSVAAGNDDKDACNYSPAASKLAMTVGASTLSDTRAYFSNFGKCVDIFAPGLNILSVWSPGNSSTNTISGTSMACPHVAGLAAYLLSIQGTDTFTINTTEIADAPSADVEASLYSNAYALLPKLARAFLPTPQIFMAPVPKKPSPFITPAQLKKAMLSLATKGALSDIKEASPNLLAFNNATIPKAK